MWNLLLGKKIDKPSQMFKRNKYRMEEANFIDLERIAWCIQTLDIILGEDMVWGKTFIPN